MRRKRTQGKLVQERRSNAPQECCSEVDPNLSHATRYVKTREIRDNSQTPALSETNTSESPTLFVRNVKGAGHAEAADASRECRKAGCSCNQHILDPHTQAYALAHVLSIHLRCFQLSSWLLHA